MRRFTAEFGPAGSLDEQHGVGRTNSAGVRLGDATGRWGKISWVRKPDLVISD